MSFLNDHYLAEQLSSYAPIALQSESGRLPPVD